MKFVASAIVALFATVAFANPTATPAPTAATPAPTAAMPAHDAKAVAPTAKTAAVHAATAADCTKMTGEAKAKCEAAAKPAHK